jgi:hypothetical protein
MAEIFGSRHGSELYLIIIKILIHPMKMIGRFNPEGRFWFGRLVFNR